MAFLTTRRTLFVTAAALALGTALTAPASAQDVTLTYLVDNAPNTVAVAEAMKADFEAKNPGIVLEIETRPQGADGDNIVKTRLATGEMTDVFAYNSGSLFQALNPTQTMLDLTDEPYQGSINDAFKTTVTGSDGKVYGVPLGAAMGGGIYYNRPIYEELGLSVPKSWSEFMANNEKIKAAGKVPVIQTFGSTWTSQLFVLGDFYNVLQELPNFATDYTEGKAKYADNPAAMKGFERQAEVFNAGYLNEDFAAATYEEGVVKVATGEGAHYPMLTFAISAIQQLAPENVGDVGFFAIPGDDAAKNGLTVWMPGAVYISKDTEHPEEARKFAAYVASVEGCDIQNVTVGATGPYLIDGCTLPADVPVSVSDMLPYFEAEGATAPALEFLSPIKGPALEQITVEVGSGIRTPADGAALYDEDVRKQAMQLGLPGWN
ncbi:MAG TPA: extracellular solute-binding protein [Devosia sp.]|jgi:raffinose/stachyose/melibiose transport system substrate-binding protein|nr:extracellular solute-binding protein [Devosia sp.]